jgi:hypothetical protein
MSAPSLLRLAFGTRYFTARPLSVASAVVFITVLNAMPSTVLFPKGLPTLHRHAVLAGCAAMLFWVHPARKFMGPIGGQVVTLFATLVQYLFHLILLRSVTGLNLFRYEDGIVPPALGSAAMLAFVLGSSMLGLTVQPIADVVICSGSCLFACALCASVHLRASKGHIGTYRDPETPPPHRCGSLFTENSSKELQDVYQEASPSA